MNTSDRMNNRATGSESDVATIEQLVFTLEKVKATARITNEDNRRTRLLRTETFSSVVNVRGFLGVVNVE